MPKLKRPRQEKFVQEYLNPTDPYNGTQSYLKAYPKAQYNTATVEASRHLVNPNIQERIRELLEKNEPTKIENLIPSLNEDLSSVKVTAYRGKLIRSRDNANILRTKEMIFKLHGSFRDGGTIEDNRQVNIVLNQVEQEKLSNIVEQLSELNKALGIKTTDEVNEIS